MFRPALVALVFASLPALVPTAALAQSPGLLPGMTVAPKGEAAFVVADTASKRFFALDETAGPELSAGEAVTVVTRAEGRVRVLVRGQFGWVPASALSSEPPVLEDDTQSDGPAEEPG